MENFAVLCSVVLLCATLATAEREIGGSVDVATVPVPIRQQTERSSLFVRFVKRETEVQVQPPVPRQFKQEAETPKDPQQRGGSFQAFMRSVKREVELPIQSSHVPRLIEQESESPKGPQERRKVEFYAVKRDAEGSNDVIILPGYAGFVKREAELPFQPPHVPRLVDQEAERPKDSQERRGSLPGFISFVKRELEVPHEPPHVPRQKREGKHPQLFPYRRSIGGHA